MAIPNDIKNRLALTTGQIGRICEVSPKLVCKWIDQGFLPGWRVPGSADRRALSSDLGRFLKDHGMDYAVQRLAAYWSPEGLPDREPKFPPTSRMTGKPPAKPKRTKSPRPGGFIYFVQTGVGTPIKIGFSYKPLLRFANLQVMSPKKLYCLGVMFGSRVDECRLHLRFNSDSIAGEWFHPSPALLAFIDANTGSLASLTDEEPLAETS